MPSRKDIPGFYYDEDKNRFFPINGPFPGSKQRASYCSCGVPPRDSSVVEKDIPTHKNCKRRKISELLQFREIGSKLLTSREGMYDFKQEFRKLQISYPMAWKYQGTADVADNALEQFYGALQTPEGLKETSFLATGSMAGTLGLYDVGLASQNFNHGKECVPEPVFPFSAKIVGDHSTPAGAMRTSAGASSGFSSGISGIKIAEHSRRILVTTLGSGECGGSVSLVNLQAPLDFQSPSILHGRTMTITSLKSTIWAMDCNSNGVKAALGTSGGSSVLDVETRKLSWVFRSQSDVFAQQFDQSGKVLLCGLRNGSIVQVDARQRPLGHRSSSYRHTHRQVVLKGKSPTSAVCSLVVLHSDEQYFVGSFMDGSIKLFDRRISCQGVVQSYEGHVNSHTRLQFGVDPSETFLMSGGEDGYTRVWSIKSGEQILRVKLSDTVLSTVCWSKNGSGGAFDGFYGSVPPPPPKSVSLPCTLTHSWGAWLGSHEGLFYIHGS